MAFVADRPKVPGPNLRESGGPRSAEQRPRDGAFTVLTVFAPSLILGTLAISQVDAVVRNGVSLVVNPNWPGAIEMVRAIIYGSFVFGGAVYLWTKRDVKGRDGRGPVVAISLIASFLLMGLSVVPGGPVLWVATTRVAEVSLGVTLIGAALALASLMRLRSNFSIVPEAHLLVVSGPYRWLRHPMYFAELVMITGTALSGSRLTFLIGAVTVVVLQICRVRAEERLLRTSFPAAHSAFAAHTRFRLIPLIW